MRYRFQGLYELDSLAVVNVRDTGPVKNGFTILMFPESHLYQTDTAKAKVSSLYYQHFYSNFRVCLLLKMTFPLYSTAEVKLNGLLSYYITV